MNPSASPASQPLCGDETCQSYGCTQEALDAHWERQWQEAGRIVAEMIGPRYTFTPVDLNTASQPPEEGSP